VASIGGRIIVITITLVLENNLLVEAKPWFEAEVFAALTTRG